MEGALNEVSDMLTRAKELCVQKANGTYSANDIANVNAELTKLQEEITHISSNTKFNGIGMNTAVNIAIDDNATTVSIAATDISSVALTSATTASEVTTMIETVSTARGNLGAMQNRLEHTSNNLGTTAENITASESRIRDTDMAKTMSEFSSKNIITQASLAMLAQANQLPQNVLSVLR